MNIYVYFPKESNLAAQVWKIDESVTADHWELFYTRTKAEFPNARLILVSV